MKRIFPLILLILLLTGCVETTGPTLYEYWTGTTPTSSTVKIDFWRGQQFTIGAVGPNEDFSISTVTLKLFRVGTPGNVIVEIYETDDEGYPTKLISGGTYDGDTLTTSITLGEEVNVSMTPAKLLASTKYVIILRVDQDQIGWKCADAESIPPANYSGGHSIYTIDYGENWKNYSDTVCYFKIWSE